MLFAAVTLLFLPISSHVISRLAPVKRQILPNNFFAETAFVASAKRTYNADVASVIERQSIVGGSQQ